jgi:DNA polymerase IV
VPLRFLFVDMNSYFASCEQQDRPELRGKPVAVIPVEADTTCCLAASYEAKAWGIKTGTAVWQAKKICPDLNCIVARPRRYMELHDKIVKSIAKCIPIYQVMSIDEMACKLLGDEREPGQAIKIGEAIKREIYARVGEHMHCSIGVAPNGLLAKMAGDMKKPNGLTLLPSEDLPHRMFALKLNDFPGIGRQMEKRFNMYNIFTVEQLYQLNVKQLSLVWGSKIHGERWYHQIRGDEVYEKPIRRRTVGQSHILPPDFRTDDGMKSVFVRLIHKACGRLREMNYWARHLSISIAYQTHGHWDAGTYLSPCQDTLSILEAFGQLWKRRPSVPLPIQVSMVLTRLTPNQATAPSLFDEDRDRNALGHTMDRINKLFGKQSVYFGGLIGAEDTAPQRIPFGSTQLKTDRDYS